MNMLYCLEPIFRPAEPPPARTLADVPLHGTGIVYDRKLEYVGCNHKKTRMMFLYCDDDGFMVRSLDEMKIIPATDIHNPDGTPLDPPSADPKPWTLGECDILDVIEHPIYGLQVIIQKSSDGILLVNMDKKGGGLSYTTDTITARYRLVPVEEPTGMTANQKENKPDTNVSIIETLEQIREHSGGAGDDVKDVEKFISEMRGYSEPAIVEQGEYDVGESETYPTPESHVLGAYITPENMQQIRRNLADANAEIDRLKVALAASEGLVRELQRQASLQADRIKKLQLDAQIDSTIKQGMATAAANADAKIEALEARIREMENVPFRFEPCPPKVKKFDDVETWDYCRHPTGAVWLALKPDGCQRTIVFPSGTSGKYDTHIIPVMTVTGRLVWNPEYQPPKISQPESNDEQKTGD